MTHPPGSCLIGGDCDHVDRAAADLAELRPCYSIEGLTAFVAKHFPAMELRERAAQPGGVKCVHCNGSGDETQHYDEETGWSEEKPCDTCSGSGRITTVEQYLKTVPANWHENSSLETWFPCTANELKTLQRKLDTCGLQCAATLKSLVVENEQIKREHAEAVKLIEGEWFQRVTYKQQARKAREENERLRATLRGISTCSTCEMCRGAATRALGGPIQLVRLNCSDCNKEFEGHAGDNVCQECWKRFNGMTLEELMGASQPPRDE